MTTQLIPTEASEQIAFIQYLKLRRLPYFHVPNSTYTDSRYQKFQNYQLGVQSGVPDLFVCVAGKLVAVEMKRTKGGVVSESQKKWLEILNAHGIEARVCKGAEEAIDFINEYLPSGKSKNLPTHGDGNLAF